MARTNPVPEREKEIASRLRQIRKDLGLSMTAFAEKAGVPHVRYASYEYGLVPLTYTAAAKICRCFKLSARWLAEGLDSPGLYMELPSLGTLAINERNAFSTIYDQHVKAQAEGSAQLRKSLMQRLVPASDPADKTSAKAQREIARGRKMLLEFVAAAYDCAAHVEAPPGAHVDLVNSILDSSGGFSAKVLNLPVPWRGGVSKLDDVSEIRNTQGVAYPTLSDLIERLRALTDPKTQRGKRSEAADFLDVSPSQVTGWLDGDYKPNGEVTLKLLSWVEEQEKLQNKSSASASTPAEPKTQRKDRDETKPSPGRAKGSSGQKVKSGKS